MNAIIALIAFVAVLRWALRWLRRRVPTWQRHPLRASPSRDPRTILVTGATGFIGQHWCRGTIERGDRLIVWTRDAERARDLYGPRASIVTALEQLPSDQRIDAIVNLAGAPIMGAPWTQRRRALLLSSRIDTTTALIELIARLERKPHVLVSMSAIGYYGVRGDEEITEADRGRPMFQSHLCQTWELTSQGAERHGVRVCRLRAGLVLGAEGGALPRLARGARMHLAVVMGSGAQWLSWIHIDDLVRMIACCVDDRDWSGAFNATAPEPVRQAQFATALAARFGHPRRVRVPERALRLAMGEMAQLLVDGQRVLPFKAKCRGFEFEHATLDAALADLRSRRKRDTHRRARGIKAEALSRS